MNRTDSYTLLLIGLNLFILFQILSSFDPSHITVIMDYRMLAGYVSVSFMILSIFFIIRNLVKGVTFFSGNFDSNTFIRSMAIDTFIVIITFIGFILCNAVMYHSFNKLIDNYIH